MMEFPLQIAVGPTPAFLSFLPDKALFLGSLEPVQVTPSRRPFRVASAQTVALEYQPL
jgi:hypothetical protein